MRIFKRIIITLLVLALAAGLGYGGWRFFLRDGQATLKLAAKFEAEGNFNWAVRCYEWAWSREPENIDIPLALADCYAAAGNDTLREATLWDAIEAMPNRTEFWFALSQAYVDQDKLLDAAHLDEKIDHPETKAAFNAARPAAPEILPEGGEYEEDCTVSLSYSGGTAYWTLTGNYPSLKTDAYTAPVRLVGQEVTVVALLVNDNGLVSPVATSEYVIGFVNEPVVIQDPTLDALLRQTMNWVEGVTLTTGMLSTVESLTLPAEVTDVSQLSLLTGLKSLDASAIQVSADWTLLSALKDLESLSLPPLTVDLHALEVIGGLTKLKNLNLSGCGITTLAPLENLTSLETLDITDCIVGDLEPLSNFLWLRSLRLGGNAVTDLAPISELTGLEELDLHGNPLRQLSGIRGLTKLRTLDISDTGTEELGDLSGLTQLESLDASDNSITSVTPLENLTKLTTLDLSWNQLQEVQTLASLKDLVRLDLSNNQLTSLPDFADDCALTFVTLNHNQLTSLEGLANLERLNYVYADYNEITDLLPLTSCHVLVQVDAFENPTHVAQALIDMGVIVNYTPVFDEETGEEITVDGQAPDGEETTEE